MFSFELQSLCQVPRPLCHCRTEVSTVNWPNPGSLSGRSLAPENLMRVLAKHFSTRTLTLQVIFVAVIAASIAGLSRHYLFS